MAKFGCWPKIRWSCWTTLEVSSSFQTEIKCGRLAHENRLTTLPRISASGLLVAGRSDCVGVVVVTTARPKTTTWQSVGLPISAQSMPRRRPTRAGLRTPLGRAWSLAPCPACFHLPKIILCCMPHLRGADMCLPNFLTAYWMSRQFADK